MSINIGLPTGLDLQLFQVLAEICRRSIDGSLNPVQINVQINVTGNDIKVVTGGKGLILPTRDGTKFGRVLLENADTNGNLTLSVDPL